MKFCMIPISVVAAILTSLPNFSSGSQRICMQLESVDSDEPSSVTRQFKQGAPGKKGAKGDVGAQGMAGPAGPPGKVDYKRINATIQATCDEKIENVRAEFAKKMKEVGSWIFKGTGVCDVYYLNVCYWIEIHPQKDTNFAEAKSICRQRQSSVAAIVDETHYQLLAEKLRQKQASGQAYAWSWLGLKRNQSEGEVTLFSGVEASYLSWRPGQPSGASTKTHIMLLVRKDAASSDQGMYNIASSYYTHGVVCQYSIV